MSHCCRGIASTNLTCWTRAMACQLSATAWRLLTPEACWHHAACSQRSRRVLKLSHPVHAAHLLPCCGSQLQAQESQLRQELLLREASLLECHQQLQEAKALLQVCGEGGGECHWSVCRGAGGRNALECSMLHETHTFPATARSATLFHEALRRAVLCDAVQCCAGRG